MVSAIEAHIANTPTAQSAMTSSLRRPGLQETAMPAKEEQLKTVTPGGKISEIGEDFRNIPIGPPPAFKMNHLSYIQLTRMDRDDADPEEAMMSEEPVNAIQKTETYPVEKEVAVDQDPDTKLDLYL